MKELINHLWENNRETIVNRSLLNCHCVGLHSIMLLESPGQTIRLYVAEKGNELYKNSPIFFERGMSVGFHPHHCNLTLHCVKGRLWNWLPFADETKDRGKIKLRHYLYKSQITDGKQGFELVNPNVELPRGVEYEIPKGRHMTMAAEALHTVYCEPFEETAWLVYEGQENPIYTPLCFSTSYLENATTDGLYQKPSIEKVVELIRMAGFPISHQNN